MSENKQTSEIMKRYPSYSLYAFIIAFLVHALIIAIFFLLGYLIPQQMPPRQDENTTEQRFRLSLKERPTPLPEAAVPNTIPKPKVTPLSIPRGEQMIKPPSPKTAAKALQQHLVEPKPAVETRPITKDEEIEKPKAFVRHEAKKVVSIERENIPSPPKKEQGLYDLLSKADGSAENLRQNTTKVTDSIQKLYGERFNDLSPGEQKYILDNQEVMRRITQAVLDRYGRTKIPDSVRANETNMIEFYLHPDGSISDIRFLKNSRLSILDETTKETIELAYAKYPRPEQKTLIRYRVWYNLGGY